MPPADLATIGRRILPAGKVQRSAKSQAGRRLTSARGGRGADREFEDGSKGEMVMEEELGGVWRGEFKLGIVCKRRPPAISA
jgi:hypothetical protein